MAEICEKYLNKGDKIYCEGRIKTRQWEQEGQKRYMTEIHVQEMNFLTPKGEQQQAPQSAIPNQAPNNPQTESETDLIDDLPF